MYDRTDISTLGNPPLCVSQDQHRNSGATAMNRRHFLAASAATTALAAAEIGERSRLRRRISRSSSRR